MSNETMVLGVSLPVTQRVGAYVNVGGIKPNPPRTEWPEPANIAMVATGAANMVDQYGFRHWHEVPERGQFRLYSACQGCDDNYLQAERGEELADYLEQMPHLTDADIHARQVLAHRGRPKPRRASSTPRQAIAITASFKTGR